MAKWYANNCYGDLIWSSTTKGDKGGTMILTLGEGLE